MSGVKGKSGGARHGTGPHRRHIQLDPDHARKLAVFTKQQQVHLNQPQLSEDEVIAHLIDQAVMPGESGSQQMFQLVQETFQQSWPEIVRQLLDETGSHLETICEQAMHHLQETLHQHIAQRGNMP